MGKPWLKALFADLAPRDDKESQSAASLSSSAEDRHAARWNSNNRTSCSPPKATYPAEDYDIAAHARAGLQISDSRRRTESPPAFLASPSHARHASSGPATPSGWRRPAGNTSPSSSYRSTTAPPPLGPRPPLYTQERPYHAEDTIPQRIRQATGPGGFINPQQGSPTHRVSVSPPSRTPKSPQYSPQRHDNASLGKQSTPPRSRPHVASTPSRPAFLATPPPRVPHRPVSDPSSNSPKKQQHSPGISRSSSDENAKPKPNQCHGTTGAGKRCTRIVKAKATSSSSKAKNTATSPPVPFSSDFRLGRDALKQLDRRLSVRTGHKALNRSPRRAKGRVIEIDSDSDDDSATDFERISPVQDNAGSEEDGFEELPVFCFQHIKQTLEQRGTFINGNSVDFQDWIPDSLPQETQLQLRHEMIKPKNDERRGYIYVHEFPFSAGQGKRTTFIKLGRSVRPVARLSQWRSQCRSREPIVRDIFPLHPTHPLHPDHTAASLINAYKASPSHQHSRLLHAGQGAKYHTRWERLCLIELAGIAAVQAQQREGDEIARQACIDCGKIHVELFLVDSGSYEWHIREMVLRWQRFVETVL